MMRCLQKKAPLAHVVNLKGMSLGDLWGLIIPRPLQIRKACLRGHIVLGVNGMPREKAQGQG